MSYIIVFVHYSCHFILMARRGWLATMKRQENRWDLYE